MPASRRVWRRSVDDERFASTRRFEVEYALASRFLEERSFKMVVPSLFREARHEIMSWSLLGVHHESCPSFKRLSGPNRTEFIELERHTSSIVVHQDSSAYKIVESPLDCEPTGLSRSYKFATGMFSSRCIVRRILKTAGSLLPLSSLGNPIASGP